MNSSRPRLAWSRPGPRCSSQTSSPIASPPTPGDRSHFRGNHPAACSLDVAELEGSPGAERLRALSHAFAELLPRAPLAGHTENHFPIERGARCTHVRLKIYPDGGVARLRIWGEARPDWRRI